MVLVPPFVEVDGLVVPLQCYEPSEGNGYRGSIGHAEQPRESKLAGFRYVIGALLMANPEEILRLLEARKDLPMPQELCADVVPHGEWDASDLDEHARNWRALTGRSPELSDVYNVGTTFLDDSLVIPGATFLALMRKLYELNAAISEGRMEPRIDDTIPLPRPR